MSEPAFELADLEAEVDTFLRDALVLLAGAGIPTPERGYTKDGRFGLLLSDLRSLVRKYEHGLTEPREPGDSTKRLLDQARKTKADFHSVKGATSESVSYAQGVIDMAYTTGAVHFEETPKPDPDRVCKFCDRWGTVVEHQDATNIRTECSGCGVRVTIPKTHDTSERSGESE